MKTKILKQFGSALLASVFLVISPVGFASTEISKTAQISGFAGSVLASRVAIDDNDDDIAVEFLQRALNLDQDNANIKQDLFVALLSSGRVEEAADIAKETQDLGRASNLRGFVLAAQAMRKRTWNKVPVALEGVEGMDLDKTLRQITMAWAKNGDAKPEEAIRNLEEIEGPELIQILKNYHTGLMASLNGNTKLAEKSLQTVIDNRAILSVLTETYLRAVEAMVRNYSKAGDKEKARETLDYGLSLIPTHVPYVALDKALKNDQVLKPFIISPQNGMAELFYNVASFVRRNSPGGSVKPYFQLAHFLNPESDAIKIQLAEVYLQQGSYERSNGYFDLIGESSPYYRMSRLEKASNLARLEKVDEAIVEAQKLVDEEPGDITGYMVLGRLFTIEERYTEAAKVYDDAIGQLGDLKRQDWNVFFRRGVVYERLKQWDKAEPNFLQALELSKDQHEVLNYLGYSWIDQGINLEEGMEMIRKAVRLQPRSGAIVDSLGWAYYRLGKYDDAVRELEKAVALLPQDPTINDHLGDAYWKVGRKLEATFQWKIALASKTEPENPKDIRQKLVEGLLDENKSEAKAEE